MNVKRLKFLSFIAFRYLKSGKNHKYPSGITVISLVGVMISVATLIIVLSVMNGFSFELKNKILGVNSHILLEERGLNSPIQNFEQLVGKLQKLPQIRYVNPVVDGQAMLINSAKNGSSGAVVKGISPKDLENRAEIYNNLVLHPDCEKDIFNGRHGVILGSMLARSIGAGIGDGISLVTATGDNTIFGFMPRYRDFLVCGVFESGASMYDSSMVLMSFDVAQVLYKHKSGASGVEIFLKDIDNTENFASFLIDDFGWQGYVSDWKRSNESLFHAMKIERTVMSLIMSLFLCVSMFGIFANMSNMVNQKGRNIAIMKTLGMTNRDVMTIFFISGSIIGICGTVIGCILGVIFTVNIENIKLFLEKLSGTTLFDGAIYFLSYLPAKIFASDLIFVILLAIFTTIISSIFPAIRAKKVIVAETLRQI